MAKQSSKGSQDVSSWVGWVYFAGILMLLSGIFQMFAGLVALFRDTVFVVGPERIISVDYTTWGWVHLLLGAVLALTAFSLMNGNAWGRFWGVVLASLSAIANFGFVDVYPIWALLVITIDILIIYAIVVHGGDA